MASKYSSSFNTDAKAESYECTEYGEYSYASLLWSIEREMLADLLAEFRLRSKRSRIDYLDFASGTGRVIAYLEDKVDRAVGIDVSPAMCKIAKSKLTRASLICCDIASPSLSVDEKYDIITSFRFLLNAEPDLRLCALKMLASKLRDENSWLILNNHGNPFSIKLAMLPVHSLQRLGKGYQASGNYLTYGEVRRLADAAGLRIERVIGYGLLGGHLAAALGNERASRIESKFLRRPMLSCLGTHQCYIASLRISKNHS